MFEDGAPQEISFFGQEDIPLRVILALPSPFPHSPGPGALPARYESFKESIERARRLALRVVESVHPGDSVGIFTICGGDISLTLPLTDDLVKVREQLEKMGVQGTCERGAIIGLHRRMLMEVVKYTSHTNRYPGRISRPIILILNEDLVDPSRPEFPLKDLVAEIISSGATICAIDLQTPFGKYVTIAKGIFYPSGIGYFHLRSKLLGYFSDLTGGLTVKENVEKPEATVKRIAVFLENMRRGYVLGFKPSRDRSEGRLVKIKVELSPLARKKNKDAQLRHRHGYIVAAGTEGGAACR
ncbi:MAG: hypothetical protein QXD59_05770 [Candidatus Caldarchaeum sp.]